MFKNILMISSMTAMITIGSVFGQDLQIANDIARQANQNRYIDKMLNFNPQTVEQAFRHLEKPMRDAIDHAQNDYNANYWQWGQIVPTYGMAKDPLGVRCLKFFQRFRGGNCQRGQEDRPQDWGEFTDLINFASSSQNLCFQNYNFQLTGVPSSQGDMSVECKTDTIQIYKYAANSKCDPSSKFLLFSASYSGASEVCINKPEINLSYKFNRDNTRETSYYKQAYAVQEWMKINQYDSNAGSCAIKGYEVYIDSSCQLRSDSIDDEVEQRIDVANQIAMAAGNRCGVIGHLFPFPSPFGLVRCNSTHFDLTQYWDWQCKEQIDNPYYYAWGQCIRVPWTKKGNMYVKLFQDHRPSQYELAVQSYIDDPASETLEADQNEIVMYILIAVVVVLVFLAMCLMFALCQLRDSSLDAVQMAEYEQEEFGQFKTQSSAAQLNQTLNNSRNMSMSPPRDLQIPGQMQDRSPPRSPANKIPPRSPANKGPEKSPPRSPARDKDEDIPKDGDGEAQPAADDKQD